MVFSVPRSRISSMAASSIALLEMAVRSAWVSGCVSGADWAGGMDKQGLGGYLLLTSK
ncbi:MAG TPA: hypothetical protein VE175_01975 [Woeseiaceae bacterium]|nr:hypothetical protein [Woeseiaceae bacterium]